MDTVQRKWEILRDEGLDEIDAPLIDLTRPQDMDPTIRLSTYGWVRGWTGEPNWLNYGLIYDGKVMKTNGSKCPKSLRIMRNLMKKRKVVMAGTPYDVYHIGLYVSDTKKCLLGVEKVIHNHKDGEIICFDDRVEHWELNISDENRLIFYIKCLKE